MVKKTVRIVGSSLLVQTGLHLNGIDEFLRSSFVFMEQHYIGTEKR